MGYLDNDSSSDGGDAGSSTPRLTYTYVPVVLPTSSTMPVLIASGGLGVLSSTGLTLRTSTGASDYAELVLRNMLNVNNVLDLNPQFWYRGGHNSFNATNEWRSFIIFGGRVPENGAVTFTRKHFGFYYKNDAGTVQLFATNGNGSAQTETDISAGLTLTEEHTFFADMTSGTDIKFYVDGVLKATHTTNLPSGSVDTQEFTAGISRTVGTTNAQLLILEAFGVSYDAY